MNQLICIILATSSTIALAKQVYYGSEVETVSVIYGSPTIFRFHEPVKTISQASRFTIEPADSETPDYAVLSVTPRFLTGKDKVTFILANGNIANVRIITLQKAIAGKSDSFYDFKPKEELLDLPDSDDVPLSELELMKAMLRGSSIRGYKINSMSKLVRTGVPNISARLIRVYSGSRFNGLVFKVRNSSKKKDFMLDLEKLSMGNPGLILLSQSDERMLKADSKGSVTILRVVVKSGTSSNQFRFPKG